jgi:hypothetical protein
MRLRALTADGDLFRPVDGGPGAFRHCGNRLAARCNWLVPVDDHSALCSSCRLTTVRPNDSEADAMAAFADAESAKRRLIYQLGDLGLQISGLDTDPVNGVSFEFLSSRGRDVTTGHENGVITLDLSESDDAHREFVRQQLGEPYRTVLGHLRHEIGHYYWPILAEGRGHIERFRQLFGDERVSYQAESERHYRSGPPSDWASSDVSQYATMHPWEHWAETFAHYLHIRSGSKAPTRSVCTATTRPPPPGARRDRTRTTSRSARSSIAGWH